MTFDSEKVDLDTLALILTELKNTQGVSGKRTLLRFLESALPPLVSASTEAHRDSRSWADFFESYSIQHMYDIVQLLMRKGPDTMRGLFFGKCPVSEETFYEAVWGYLTQYTPGSVTLPVDTTDQQPAEPMEAESTGKQGNDKMTPPRSTGSHSTGRKRPPQDDGDGLHASQEAQDRDFLNCSEWPPRKMFVSEAFRDLHPLLVSGGGELRDYDNVFQGPGRWWPTSLDDKEEARVQGRRT